MQFARELVSSTLARLARRRLKLSHTEVIGITGSVGKTTCKEALAKILKKKFSVFASQKSYNSEFGVPLSILEEETGYSSAGAWSQILLRSEIKSFKKFPAEKLILELAVDHPGDMKKLLKIVRPKIGVITAIKPVHLAEGQFESVEEIAVEKGLLVEALPKDGYAILNADDPLASKLETSAKIITWSLKNPATLSANKIVEGSAGITLEIKYENEHAKLRLPILGKHNLHSILAAVAVSRVLGVSLEYCATALADFRLPPGRLNPITGVNGSQIIDSSYNANPASMLAALETFANLNNRGRKIAILGQMNELGTQSKKFHREIGKKAAEIADEVIGVFGDAKIFAETAAAKKKANSFFETADAAGEYLKTKLKSGDLVLVKGSQNNVRLENCIKRIMREPNKAKELLCRQD